MSTKPKYIRPLDIMAGRVDMNHGAGGGASAQLIEEIFLRAFDNEYLRQGNDGAVLPLPPELLQGARLVMSTDAHVVSPIFFPGGDLGCLAVHGTLNDVAMQGARPLYLSASFILEEGYPLIDLQRLANSMGAAARDAGVPIVTGDTKVVEQGNGHGVFISTTGLGILAAGVHIGGDQARPGDVVLVSGTLGEHGVAVLSSRTSLEFETTIVSDTAALHGLVADLLAALPPGSVHVLRDPTRGGLATTLNEITRQSGVGMLLDENSLPLLPQVEAACELLGLDPLYIANEGKMAVICAPEVADAALRCLRVHPLGLTACRIGVVTEDPHCFVQMQTRVGGRRVVDWLRGEQLPRIC
jgi:hydrogenase expression/formation protein HypE